MYGYLLLGDGVEPVSELPQWETSGEAYAAALDHLTQYKATIGTYCQIILIDNRVDETVAQLKTDGEDADWLESGTIKTAKKSSGHFDPDCVSFENRE